jgi:hypothetical protein
MYVFYKIVFPECCCLYAGITGTKRRRYGSKNRLGGEFSGPHTNPDVQRLINLGFFSVWVPVKTFETEAEVKALEKRYLQRVWGSGKFKDRPAWLLNRCNESLGSRSGSRGPNSKIKGVLHYTKQNGWNSDKHWTKQPENREKLRELLLNLTKPEIIQKRVETRRLTENNPDYLSPLVGRKRPEHSALMKQKTKCPYCELFSNPGGLATHLKNRHPEENNAQRFNRNSQGN